jgi:hypothetical protein
VTTQGMAAFTAAGPAELCERAVRVVLDHVWVAVGAITSVAEKLGLTTRRCARGSQAERETGRRAGPTAESWPS